MNAHDWEDRERKLDEARRMFRRGGRLPPLDLLREVANECNDRSRGGGGSVKTGPEMVPGGCIKVEETAGKTEGKK